ncbi:MAG: hypothetical protein PHY24_05405, partial [Candidatus Cloacimonetes bacterium]|nr:hypothetical protein [Candidatus Cloacimonadota bacterium]
MSSSLRYLPLLMVAILLLSSCATVPKAEPSEKVEELHIERPIDRSNPNLASMYYFMSGSFLHFSGDLAMADQVLNLALTQDPGSFQIRKLLFVNTLQIYLYMQNPETEQQTREMLSLARDSYDFDQEMLTLAYRAYRHLNDSEGVDWALQRLLKDHPKAQVYIWEYIRQKESGSKAPERLLEKALKAERDNPEIEYVVASLYLDINPKRAQQILLDSKRSKAAELQLLELYRIQGQEDELQAHFATYSYPEDKEKIHEYLMFLQQYAMQELALTHLDEILLTGDTELIEALSYLAFAVADHSPQTKIYQYLSRKLPAPADDSPIAAILLLHHIVHPEFTQGRHMTDKIYQIKDLVFLSYFFLAQNSLSQNPEEEHQKVFLQLHQLIQKNLESSVVKDFLLDHTALLAGLQDAGSRSAVALSEW